MAIDIAFLILLVIGLFMGITRGAIHSLLSFVGWLLGAAIAIKWSHTASLYLQNHFNNHSRWMPLFTFVLLFIGVIILVHLLSKLLEASVSTVGLGWVNKLIGGALWCTILTFVMSIFLWFGNHMKAIDDPTKTESKTYTYLEPIAPCVIGGFGKVLPWFKDEFEHLEKVIEPHAEQTK